MADVTPENGVIYVDPYWLCKTSSGGDFGFDPGYKVIAAFVDYGDKGTYDPGADAQVETFTASIADVGTNNERIVGDIKVSGLDDGDNIVLECWVVLKDSIGAKVTGNIATGIETARTADGTKIVAPNKTDPLLQVGDFYTPPNPPDLSITKLDTPDPIEGGGVLSYAMTVTNVVTDAYYGDVANNVMVRDTLDPGTTYVAGSLKVDGVAVAPSWDTNGDMLIPVGFVDRYASKLITFDVTVAAQAPWYVGLTLPPAGTATDYDRVNKAVVSGYGTDPFPANNTAFAYTNVYEPIPDAPSVTLDKSVEPTSVYEPGGTVAYSFKVSNTSPSKQAVYLTEFSDDKQPSFTLTGLSWKTSAGEAITDIAAYPLAYGDYVTATKDGTVSGNYPDVVTNTATVKVADSLGQTATAQDSASVDHPPADPHAGDGRAYEVGFSAVASRARWPLHLYDHGQEHLGHHDALRRLARGPAARRHQGERPARQHHGPRPW